MNAHARLSVVVFRAVLLVTLFPPASGAVDPAAARQELERIEDLRLLHRHAIQDLHDARALALYLRGWGGADQSGAVESLFVETESLYGMLRGIDHGGQALQAQMDVLGENSPTAAQWDLLQRARGEVARRVNAHYDETLALKNALSEAVQTAAKGRIRWELTSQPAPWPDAAREAGRREGLRYGWKLDGGCCDGPEGDYILGKARKMGIAFVNVSWAPISNWGDIERAPGRYDFAALDAALARFDRFGLKVVPMLHTFTGSPPPWWIEKTGADCRFTTTTTQDGKDGRKVQSGINLFHAATAEAFAKFLTAYAAHLKEQVMQLVEGVYVEGGQHETEAVPDESPAMDAYWRRWSRTDTPWRTPEAIAASSNIDESAYARAEMCREAWLADYIRFVREALKKGWAELPVQHAAIGDDFHRLFAGVTGRSRNALRLCELADNPGSSTDNSASFELLRDFAGDRWLWQLGIHAGSGTTAGAAGAQPLFYGATRIVTGGPTGGIRINFPPGWFRYCDRQIGDFGIGSYSLSPRRAQEIGPIVFNTRPAPAQVAILWSQTTLRRDRSRELFRDALAWGHLLKRAGVDYVYLAEDQLAAQLKNYRMLILPNTQSMTLEICQVLRAWVRSGGVLMGFGAPGLYDECGRRRTGLPLADVFGADMATLRVPAPVTPDKLFTGHPEGAYSFSDPAPRSYMFRTNLTAALKVNEAKPRAWFAGAEKDVAMVEYTFGSGRTLLCGYPLGYLYWESAPYELGYGITHSRQLNYNEEQKRYERWIVAELEKVGLARAVTVPVGRFLRAQRGDDPDWYHIYRDGPKYREYMYEVDQPARTVFTFLRQREGITNLYVGLLHTEANFMWERGYFRSTLAGGEVTVSVALPAQPPDGKPAVVVVDARLGVPVPSAVTSGRVAFQTWLPMAQAGAFAVSADGRVRLFGGADFQGEHADAIRRRTRNYETENALAPVEILDADRIGGFLAARKGRRMMIGSADPRFKPAAEMLVAWLAKAYGIEALVTLSGPRATCRFDYMDGFGWGQYGDDPVRCDILVGNCQDNSLMWRFLRCSGDCSWLPLEVNEDFPGSGHALVMLSAPVVTQANGRPGGKQAEPQLVISASHPTEALEAIKLLKKRLK